jgi:hypothetical protein
MFTKMNYNKSDASGKIYSVIVNFPAACLPPQFAQVSADPASCRISKEKERERERETNRGSPPINNKLTGSGSSPLENLVMVSPPLPFTVLFFLLPGPAS